MVALVKEIRQTETFQITVCDVKATEGRVYSQKEYFKVTKHYNETHYSIDNDSKTFCRL